MPIRHSYKGKGFDVGDTKWWKILQGLLPYFMNGDKTRTYLSGPENEARWLSGKAREDIFLHVPFPFLSS